MRSLLILLALCGVAAAQPRPPIQLIYGNGTLMPGRSAINFSGATITDDSLNKRLNVNITGIDFSVSPTWTGTHTFNNTITAPGMTAPGSSTPLVLKSAYANATFGGVQIWANGTVDGATFPLSIYQNSGQVRVWGFTGTTGTGPAINAYNDAPAFVGGLWFNASVNAIVHNGGLAQSLGSTATPWLAVTSKVYHGAQQSISGSGATSITVANGETIRVTPTANITSLTLSAGSAGDHLVLILVGSGGFTWPAAASVTPTTWPAGTFPSPTGTQTNVCRMAWDTAISKWQAEDSCAINLQ